MASDEYRKVGTCEDVFGDLIDFGVKGDVVIIETDSDMHLDAAKQEEFAQLYVAACHQAKVNAEAERQAEADGALCPDCGQPGCPHQAEASPQ